MQVKYMPKTEPLEATISKGIVKAINAIEGCRVKKFHGSAFGCMELDIYGCCRGRAVFLETKRTTGKVSPRQEVEIERWRATGALVGVVHNKEEALALIKPALENEA